MEIDLLDKQINEINGNLQNMSIQISHLIANKIFIEGQLRYCMEHLEDIKNRNKVQEYTTEYDQESESELEPVQEPIITPKIDIIQEPIITPKIDIIQEPIITPKIDIIQEPIITPKIDIIQEPIITPKIDIIQEPIITPKIDIIQEPIITPKIDIQEPKIENIFPTIRPCKWSQCTKSGCQFVHTKDIIIIIHEGPSDYFCGYYASGKCIHGKDCKGVHATINEKRIYGSIKYAEDSIWPSQFKK